MKTSTFFKTLGFLTIALSFSSTLSIAAISPDLREDLPSTTSDAKIRKQTTDGVVVVRGAEIKMDLYAKPIFLEVEIKDLSYDREIYVVSFANRNQLNNKNTKAEFISGPDKSDTWMSNGGDSEGIAQVLYVGRGENNTSRFLILAPGLVPNAHINIYVKMNNIQYSTTVDVDGGF